MGQKVHPIGLRLGIHRKWKSSWYFDFHNYTKFLHINFDIEKFFKGFLYYYPIKTLLINCQIIKLPSNTLYIFIFFYRLRRKKKKTKKIFKLNTINIELPKKKIIQYSNLNKLKKLNQNLNCLNFNKLNSIILNKNINQFDINNNLKDIKNYIKILLLLNANKRKVFNNFRYQRLVKVFFNKIEHKVQILLINLKNVIYYYKIINNLKKKNKNFNIENNKYLINLYTNKVLYNLEYINYIIKKDFDKFNYYDLFLVLASDYINTLSKSKINYKNLINKKKYNRNIFKYINKEKLKKKIFLKKNLYSNIKDIKIFLSKLTNSKVNIIFINALSFSKFYYYLPKKDNKSVEQPNFLLGIEQQIINIYKYNAIYVKDLINIAFISILFKNSEFLAKFIGFQFKKTPKNKKQTKLIQLINQVVSLFAFRRKEIVGLKLKFKGRINRRKRAKSIIINKGILSLQTTETRVEYGYSEGYTRYGLIGIKIWIFYEKAFKNEFKNFFYKYIKYSQKKVELEQC